MSRHLLRYLFHSFLVVGLLFSAALPAAAHLVQAEPPATAAPAPDHSLWQDFTHGRFYVAGRLGFVGTEDVKYANEVGEVNFQQIDQYRQGRSGGLAVGYQFACARFEVAGSYSENRLSDIDVSSTVDCDSGDEEFPGVHILNVTGRSELADVLLNFYLDFRNSSRFTPFVGFGLGAVYNKQSAFSGLPAVIDNDFRHRVIHDGDWAFAYQAEAGFNFNVNQHVLAGLAFRYLVIDSAAFNGRDILSNAPNCQLGLKQNQKASRFSRSARFGLTYLFEPVQAAV